MPALSLGKGVPLSIVLQERLISREAFGENPRADDAKPNALPAGGLRSTRRGRAGQSWEHDAQPEHAIHFQQLEQVRRFPLHQGADRPGGSRFPELFPRRFPLRSRFCDKDTLAREAIFEMKAGTQRTAIMKRQKPDGEAGAMGYILMWLIGIPIPILLLIFLLRGCS